MLSKKALPIMLTLIIVASSFMVFSQNISFAATLDPVSLKIFIGPSSVLADNNTYNCIFVQLQDSSKKPARALEDTTIALSSSLTSIGTVDSSITIPKGETYASANFHSTFSPGTSIISASATGFATVQASITTIGPIPNRVAIYGFPSTLPADGNTYDSVIVQLQDSSGSPAKAPKEGVQVTLSCSNTTAVGTITSNVTIPEGKTYTVANFTTSLAAQIEGKIKTATISTVAQGYASQQLTITTTPISSNPYQIKIFVGPTQIPADENSYPQIAIELQNATGFVSTLPVDTIVSVASSDPTIGQIDSEITIPANQAYSVATLNTTYKAGVTTITAVATDLQRGQQAITTTGFTPSKLAVYCVPATLPSDNATYNAVVVQLQDSQGRPAKDPATDVNVNLFSSQPTVGTVGSTLTIPFGQTQATGTITMTNAPGSTSITAQASSYTTGQGTMTTYLIDFSPLQVTVAANPVDINNGNITEVTAYIIADNTPITGATIQFTSDNGGKFTSIIDQGNGYYKTNFTAPSFTKSTACTITASASKTAYISSQATVQVIVSPFSIENSTSNSTEIIQLLIQDNSGNPLSGVNVSSTAQPDGMAKLSGVTNASGYITFTNVTAGQYSFSAVKEGYSQMNKTVVLREQPLMQTWFLSSTSSPSNNNTIIIAIVIIAVVIVALVTGLFLFKRRRSSANQLLPIAPLAFS